MSFKTLQNALFQMSGSRAMPNYSSSIEHSGIGTYVAPYDGYIQVHTVAGAEIDESQLSINNTRIANLIALLGGNWLDFIVPVHKGDNCLVNVTGENSSVIVRFYKTVGGGLIAFCRKLCRGFGEVCYG